MSKTHRRQAEELFQRAVEMPLEQRKAFLDEQRPADPAVRVEVEKLLVYSESGKNASLQEIENLDREETEFVGKRIGPYKLLQLIGEGGFGSVYMAEQMEPIRRKVALKIIKLGMDTKQVIARFEAERQALAMMDHANIARVFEAGATETGRPYFVMELVKGIPITEYCDLNALSTPQRLELFIQACRAVQHAHQKGVIHRDIKPSNILVTLHDSRPVPKVIDFGVARATDQPLTQKTVFTKFGQFIGTPQYMSPEQAALSGLDIDTRADIYSLGVLLYELLTGTTPFDASTLCEAGIGEMQRIIREECPPTPSKRVSTLGERSAQIARTRQVETRGLSRIIRGDLDWIVMKALEKDRVRRYETAESLAIDVERYMTGDPVEAGPPSKLYRFRKAVTRHKVGFGFVGALFVLVTAFGIWMGIMYSQADRLRSRAEEERSTAVKAREAEEVQRKIAEVNFTRASQAELLAMEEATTAKEVSEFLVRLIEDADPTQVKGGAVTVREILDRGADKIETELDNEPEIQASLQHTIGRIYTLLGDFEKAAPLLEQTLAFRLERFGREHPDTISTLNVLGMMTMFKFELEEAERILKGTVETSLRVLGNDHYESFLARRSLAWVYGAQQRYVESEELLKEVLEIGRRILGDDHPETITTLNHLVIIVKTLGKLEEAEALGRETVEICQRVHGEDHLSTAESMVSLGVVLMNLKEPSQAEPLLRKAMEVRQRAPGENNVETVEAVSYLGCAVYRLGRLAEAQELSRRAVDGFRHIYGDEHQRTYMGMAQLGEALLDLAQLEEAVQLLDKAFKGFEQTYGNSYGGTRYIMRLLARAYLDLHKAGEADVLLCRYLDLMGDRHPVPKYQIEIAVTRCLLAESLVAQGRSTEAEALFHESYLLLETNLNDFVDETAKTVKRVAALHETWGKPEQASRWRGLLAGKGTSLRKSRRNP